MNLPTLEELLILVDEYGDQCWNDGIDAAEERSDATATARSAVAKALEKVYKELSRYD